MKNQEIEIKPYTIDSKTAEKLRKHVGKWVKVTIKGYNYNINKRKQVMKKEFINYCANHFVISNIAGNHCDITMNDCSIGIAHRGSIYKDSYPIGLGLYTSNSTPRLLFKYDISKVESYKDFEKNSNEPSNIACIGFSESQQGWLGWSHRACFFFKIGYVVKEGSSCTETWWLEDYAKQHPEKCFNLPVGFTCKTLDDCRKCAIAYAMAVA